MIFEAIDFMTNNDFKYFKNNDIELDHMVWFMLFIEEQ